MNAKIDIKTPAGKSLEGFPLEAFEGNKYDIEVAISNSQFFLKDQAGVLDIHPKLTKGDTITIEILWQTTTSDIVLNAEDGTQLAYTVIVTIHTNMTDTQLIIAVAKLDDPNKITWVTIDAMNHPVPEPYWWIHPDCKKYLTSRDAIIPVIEKVFSKITCHSFFDTLGIECAKDTADVDGQYEYQGDGSYYEQWLIFKATPKQLSIALVKATGNWTER